MENTNHEMLRLLEDDEDETEQEEEGGKKLQVETDEALQPLTIPRNPVHTEKGEKAQEYIDEEKQAE